MNPKTPRGAKVVWEIAERILPRTGKASWWHNQALMAAIDALNLKYGKDTVKCGWFPSSGKWRTRFAQLSPRYTTKWDELLHIG